MATPHPDKSSGIQIPSLREANSPWVCLPTVVDHVIQQAITQKSLIVASKRSSTLAERGILRSDENQAWDLAYRDGQ